MRNIYLSCCFFVLLFFVHCDGGGREYIKYSFLNQSQYNISIQSYSAEEIDNTNSIFLNKNGGVWQSEMYLNSGPSPTVGPPDFVLNGDSIVIGFDNKKREIFLLKSLINSTDGNSILDPNNYQIIKEEDNLEVLIFIFTNEDYENAEEIVD